MPARVVHPGVRRAPRRAARIRVLRRADPVRERAYAAGQRVREARLRQGWRQEDLADATGIARPNIARLESGRHLPSIETLLKVADALKVELHDLLALVEGKRGSDDDRILADAGIRDFSRVMDREDRHR